MWLARTLFNRNATGWLILDHGIDIKKITGLISYTVSVLVDNSIQCPFYDTIKSPKDAITAIRYFPKRNVLITELTRR